MFDVLSLAKLEQRDDGRTWFTVEPAVIYPATIERILEVLRTGEYPKELEDYWATKPEAVAEMLVKEAKQVEPYAWQQALQPLQPNHVRHQRALALEVARHWFTQALQVTLGGNGTPMGVHILKNRRYAL